VAGKSCASYVTALRGGGVLTLVGAVAGSNVSLDAYRLIEVTLTGSRRRHWTVLRYDGRQAASRIG
jgi:hypothetical protein